MTADVPLGLQVRRSASIRVSHVKEYGDERRRTGMASALEEDEVP